MANTNCLEGIACPKCGQDERFAVEVKTIFELTDDGLGDHGDTHYDEDSYFECLECHHCGQQGEFFTEETASHEDE